ncbi:hypothetical protein SERLA73DRAFT_71968 [Serpula lacrymans var. lacrymans S7.3]|uniref:GAG-pre-integrase domain-containing protein n=1 Tax=Serpula lacrymans var. lacrymans (strain S7.3) TaxID=936435 RepID=F8PTH1_SERL3|nr:hypothetical protein SERLA73DRAFT_71968 [Serpula lacrymans var. lacrymans S7.3]
MVTKRQLQDIDTLTGTPEFCEPCALGKMKKLPFKSTGGNRAKRPIQIVHTDMISPNHDSKLPKSFWVDAMQTAAYMTPWKDPI